MTTLGRYTVIGRSAALSGCRNSCHHRYSSPGGRCGYGWKIARSAPADHNETSDNKQENDKQTKGIPGHGSGYNGEHYNYCVKSKKIFEKEIYRVVCLLRLDYFVSPVIFFLLSRV
jgi:hypothetical protein